MSYAVRKDGQGWRAVDGIDNCTVDETWQEDLPPMPTELPAAIINAKLTVLREVREAILNRLAGIALAAQLTGDTATVQAYLAARKSLLDITKDLPTELHDIELAIYGRYQAIVSTVQLNAPSLITAFAGVDL